MNNNDILRQLRYSLDISNPKMVAIFKLAGSEIDQSTLLLLLKKEEEEGFTPCSNETLSSFLDGLITDKRGRQETAAPLKVEPPLDNNAILRKIRIALNLKEDDMLAIMKLAGVNLSKPELSALFRARGHKHYKECRDQFLRKFLQGLTRRYRTAQSP